MDRKYQSRRRIQPQLSVARSIVDAYEIQIDEKLEYNLCYSLISIELPLVQSDDVPHRVK